MRSNLVSLACLIASVPAAGQINCTITNVETTTINAQTCTKKIKVHLTCSSGAAVPSGANVPGVDISVSTSLPGTPGTTPQLSVDYYTGSSLSATFAQPNSSTGVSFSGQVMGNGAGISYGGAGFAPSVYSGFEDGTTGIIFRNVPYDPGRPRDLLIVFWVNACFANSDSVAPFTVQLTGKIVASATGTIPVAGKARPADSTSGPTFTITPSQVNLGSDLNCFVFQTSAGSAPGNAALNASLFGASPTVPTSASATLSINALFPNCFDIRASGFQNDFTTSYQNEFGYSDATHPSPFTNVGTQFQATFNNIPAGVSVFVPTMVTNSLGTIALTSTGTTAASTGLTQIPVSNGSATAIWEVQSASTTATGAFAIPVYLAYQAGVASPSHITVYQTLASSPGGIQYLATPTNQLQPVLFSINTGASGTPKLTATLDSRPCIVGVTFLTNNACAPASGLPISVVSDTGPALLSSPVFTNTGGVSLSGGSFATTPGNSQIYVKPGTATPGTYPESVTYTGAGTSGGASVTVPFQVTVLDPNSPVFEANAIGDALSFVFGTIAPGQIYILFGSNFGPPALVGGTVDANGFVGTNVANTQVFFDGVASPLLYVANGFLAGVAPFEIAGKSTTNVQIVYNNLKSPLVPVPVAAAIAIDTQDGSGGNAALVFNKDGTKNTPDNPASVGDQVLIVATYAGPFANGYKGVTGRSTIGPPYPAPAGPVSVTIGGVPATNIVYFANAPTEVETVLQINVVIPPGAPSGPYDLLQISAGGATSPPWTTIAVR